MRAVRFSVELDFEIEMKTRRAIVKLAGGLEAIAKERVRDELVKILMTPNAAKGIILLEELDLLRYVLPELREGIGVAQNKHHIYTVFEHNVRALDYAARENYSLVVRMASLLHDVGKPKVKGGTGADATFYQHEYVGARMAVKALDRLRFSKEFVEQVAHLVRMHMFNYETGVISPAGVRRLVARVGPENIDDLLKIREADRIGSGVKKAVPYRLRHLLFMIEKVKRDPLSPKMLALRGDDLMPLLNLPQSRRVGWILNALMEEVIDDPKKNEKKYLEKRANELNKLSDAELQELFVSAQQKKREAEGEMDEDIKKKHHVK
jgi:poly(A) polymerase/tRNA nucleotidyltransferase (CCA-adding enzyme)